MLPILLGFMSSTPVEGKVTNDQSTQLTVQNDNHYQFQQYVLSCTREWTANGYGWSTLNDAEHFLPQEVWEGFMRMAENYVWSAYNYASDSYVIWRTEGGYTVYTLMCMCEQYYSGSSFTPLTEYRD